MNFKQGNNRESHPSNKHQNPQKRSRTYPPLIVISQTLFPQQVSDTRVILNVTRTSEIATVCGEPDIPAVAGIPRGGQAAD